MQVSESLKRLSLGNSVAEFDDALERYFVETEPFRALVSKRIDIVAGDKGTGKTAIFKILSRRYRQIPQLRGVEVIPGFNVAGNPVFQRLVQQEPLTEGQYIGLWKTYFLSLVGNWLLEIFEGEDSLNQLSTLIEKSGLRSKDDKPETVFSQIANAISRVFHPKSAEAEITLSETGIPIVRPKIVFDDANKGNEQETVAEVRHEASLGILNTALESMGVTAWIALDRLDEAFQGFPDVEMPALRALLRTYLDLQEFENIRLKLFVRRDLFRKVIRGGFVNLTHVNAKKVEIVWDEDDLLKLLYRRMEESPGLLEDLGAVGMTAKQVFDRVFPQQVDVGERKPTTWNWMMSRIRDGNHIKPPRNLIDLAEESRQAQLRREDRENRALELDKPLIEADSIRRALGRLSSKRVEDSLLAEAGDSADDIARFRGGKAEHNDSSLASLLGVTVDEIPSRISPLVEFGFLEAIGTSYKIPILFREGLGITQGKAFTVEPNAVAEEDEE